MVLRLPLCIKRRPLEWQASTKLGAPVIMTKSTSVILEARWNQLKAQRQALANQAANKNFHIDGVAILQLGADRVLVNTDATVLAIIAAGRHPERLGREDVYGIIKAAAEDNKEHLISAVKEQLTRLFGGHDMAPYRITFDDRYEVDRSRNGEMSVGIEHENEQTYLRCMSFSNLVSGARREIELFQQDQAFEHLAMQRPKPR